MKKIDSDKIRIHLVFSSHWDREWYLPFQHFRAKLVRILDQVLLELEEGRLPFYQMDGQFIPVQDYLEVRPEKEPLVRRLVSEGKFLIGPWFTLPDEFLVSGESLVRNLQLGLKCATAWGRTSRAGWLCDLFGHNSQMPQIFRLLGIESAFLWRGVPPHLGSKFVWSAADGSAVRAEVFPPNGYCDFGFVVRAISSHDVWPSADEMVVKALDYLKSPAFRGRKQLLWFDGADHIEFDPVMLNFVRKFNEIADTARIEVSTLDRFFHEARKEKTNSDQMWRGELREPCSLENSAWLIPGVGSSRVPLKKANHFCETILTLWAEPWCARASTATGSEYPSVSLDLAWQYLLTNHPHDSICGCSPDETHADMFYRFAQCRHLAEAHLESSFSRLNDQALQVTLQENELGLGLYAPVGGDTQSCPEAYVKLPPTWPQFNEFFGFEPKPSLRIFTPNGKEVSYQLLQVIPHRAHFSVALNKMPRAEDRIGVRLALNTKLAPSEAQYFILRPATGPTRAPAAGAIGVASDRLRNAYLDIKAEPNGTLTLTDLASGRIFSNQLMLEDTADIGDGWFHGPAQTDKAYLSTGGRVAFGLTENGPLLARMHVRVEWDVPREFDFPRGERSGELTPLVVEYRVTLRKESRYAEVGLTVHNTARDHNLRLICPTNCTSARTFWADSPFDAVERPIAVRKDGHLLRELPVEMTPQQNWLAVSAGKMGLALLAPGQYESCVLDKFDRPLALTLLRAFRRAVFSDANEGGQIQGDHHFSLGLAPFIASRSHPIPQAQLSRWAQNLAAPVRSQLTSYQSNVRQPPRRTEAFDEPSIEGNVVRSACFSPAPNLRILRFYNPSHHPQPVQLIHGSNWEEIDLEGNSLRTLTKKTFLSTPHKIITLRAKV